MNCGRVTAAPLKALLSPAFIEGRKKAVYLCPDCLCEDIEEKTAECCLCGGDIFPDETRYETSAGDIFCENCVTTVN